MVKRQMERQAGRQAYTVVIHVPPLTIVDVLLHVQVKLPPVMVIDCGESLAN